VSKVEHKDPKVKLKPNTQERLLLLRSKDYPPTTSHSSLCHACSGLTLNMVHVRSKCEGVMLWRCIDSSEEITVAERDAGVGVGGKARS
jgi:DNA mismatch repair protein MutH